MAKTKTFKELFDLTRGEMPRPVRPHKDKNKYNRKDKHKESYHG